MTKQPKKDRKRSKSPDIALPPAKTAPSFPPQSAAVAERKAAGRALRDRHPLTAQGTWRAAMRAHDPIDLLIESSKGRVENLLPIRYGRMLASPFTFFRGSAAVMAADLARTPSPGLRVQACGDCHLANFGGFSTPERRLVFDINDFDETSVAPWEWDVKRLAASFHVAGRNRRFSEDDSRECAWRAARSYRKRMAKYAEMPVLDAWYDSFDLEDLIEETEELEGARAMRRKLEKSTAASTHELEFAKLAEQTEPTPRIMDQPPLIYHFGSAEQSGFRDMIEESFRRYKETLPHELRILVDRYKLIDVAVKVVGVGSVGTFCGIILLHSGAGDPLFLQFKEARPSVLEPYAGASRYAHDGERVVRGQRLMQSASDMFLGWLTGAGDAKRSFYVRQLNDVKIKVPLEAVVPSGLKTYARVCGMALARAHVRSADAVLLSGYLGGSDAFDDAMADFAAAYADQTERDHEALAAAVRSGRVDAVTETEQ
jgi:uncharacterized protein (DUF2252 family)